MNKLIKILLPVILVTFFAACSSGQKQVGSYAASVQQLVDEDLSKMRTSQEYILQSGDLLEIQVFMEPDMDRTLRISGDGTITYPLVGNVNLKSITVAAAEDKLVSGLKTYIKNPQVSILIKEYGNKTVYVLGQVTKPQAIEIPPGKPLTVLEAISSVGGFTDIAAPAKVRVLRMDDGRQKSIDVDVSQITKQGNKALDITLIPGDIIFVPQSMF